MLHKSHLEIDCSLTQHAGLVYCVSYVASYSKKAKLLGLKMVLHTGQYERSILLRCLCSALIETAAVVLLVLLL